MLLRIHVWRRRPERASSVNWTGRELLARSTIEDEFEDEDEFETKTIDRPLDPSPANLAGAFNKILVGCELFQTHRATGVKPVGADPDFRSETEFAAIIEPR